MQPAEEVKIRRYLQLSSHKLYRLLQTEDAFLMSESPGMENTQEPVMATENTTDLFGQSTQGIKVCQKNQWSKAQELYKNFKLISWSFF